MTATSEMQRTAHPARTAAETTRIAAPAPTAPRHQRHVVPRPEGRPTGGRSYGLVRLLRDIKGSWTQFIAVFCMACLSVAAYGGLEGAWNGLRVNLNNFATSSAMADLWVSVTTFSDDDLSRLRGLDGVTAADVRHQASARLQLPDGEIWLDLTLAEDPEAWSVSRPQAMSGAALTDATDGLWLDDRLASHHDLAVGAPVTLAQTGGQGQTTQQVTLLGTVVSPDEVFAVRPADLALPAPNLTGYGYITPAQAAALLGATPMLATTVVLRTDGDATALAQTIRDTFPDQVMSVADRDGKLTVSAAFDRVSTLRNVSLIFSALFILVAVLAMYTSVRRLVDAQAKSIATLRALGFSRGELIRHFSTFGLVAGSIGAVAGLAVSPIFSAILVRTQPQQFDLPHFSIVYTPVPVLVAAFVVLSCLVGAGWAARSCASGEPAELLRPGIPTSGRGTSHRAQGLWRRLSYPARWAARDTLANPVRLLMGVAGVVGSTMLLFAGLGLPDTIRGETEAIFGASRAPYVTRVDFVPGTPAAALGQLPALGSSAQLLMQVAAQDTGHADADTAVTVLDAGDLFPLTDPKGAALNPPGVWLTEGTAAQLDLKVGDTVDLTLPLGLGQAHLTVDALTDQATPQGFFVDRTTWESLGLTFTPTAALLGDDADLAALADHPAVSFLVDRVTQHDNALGMMDIMSGVFFILRVFAVILTVVILYSLGSLTFDERKRPYATLKVLGLSTGELRRLSIIDNAGMTLLGLILGVPAGMWLLQSYVDQFSSQSIHYSVRISPLSVVIALLLTTVVSMLTTLLLGRRIGHVDVVEALKGVD